MDENLHPNITRQRGDNDINFSEYSFCGIDRRRHYNNMSTVQFDAEISRFDTPPQEGIDQSNAQ
jgi:hypothetical protein